MARLFFGSCSGDGEKIQFLMAQDLIFQKEFASDFLKWIRFAEENKLTDGNFDQILSLIQEKKDPSLAFFFAQDTDFEIDQAQKVILESKNSKFAVLFAQFIKGADTPLLQKIVEENKNPKHAAQFACFVRSAEIFPLEKIVLSANDPKLSHMMMKHVKNLSSTKQFKKIIFSSKKPRYIFELAKHLTDPKDLKKAEDLIIKSKSPLYCRLFAQKIKSANTTRIEEALLSFAPQKELKKFARSVKSSKLKIFLTLS